MDADEGACRLAIEVQVADVELLLGTGYALCIVREERTRQAKLGIIGDVQRVVKVSGFDEGQDGAKDFFLRDTCMWVNIGDDGWLNKVAGAGMSTAEDKASLMLANLDVVNDFLHRVLIDHRTHIGRWLGHIAHRQLFGLLNHLL